MFQLGDNVTSFTPEYPSTHNRRGIIVQIIRNQYRVELDYGKYFWFSDFELRKG